MEQREELKAVLDGMSTTITMLVAMLVGQSVLSKEMVVKKFGIAYDHYKSLDEPQGKATAEVLAKVIHQIEASVP